MTLQNVTVIIPAHNRPERLRRLLDYYSRTDIKVLVPDSSDHPFADAEKYPDITYLHRPKLHFNAIVHYLIELDKLFQQDKRS